MRRRLRIFVASAASLLTDHVPYGEGLIAWNTFAALAARGHDLTICTRRADLRQVAPFTVIETGYSSRLESIEPLLYGNKVRALFDRHGGPEAFDVVHWLFPPGPANAFVPPRGTRLVVGPLLPQWPSTAMARPRRAGDLVRTVLAPLFASRRTLMLERASRILVSTPAARAVVPPALHHKTRVCPYGVQEEFFTPAPLPQRPVVLFVGRLDPEKGVRDLVEAFARVRADVPDAVLMLAGDGRERGWVEQRIRELGLDGSLQLLGPVPHGRIPNVLRQCSLFCLPSHGEPFGMAILEAMAAGRAVVAVDESGPRHLVVPERGGRLVPRADPGTLAVALAELLGNRAALDQMGRFNRAQVEDRFSLSRLVDRLESIYEGMQ